MLFLLDVVVVCFEPECTHERPISINNCFCLFCGVSFCRTSYDGGTKQHWLSLYKGRVVGRFMIKDSSLGTNDATVNDHVRDCVDQMIVKLNDIDSFQT